MSGCASSSRCACPTTRSTRSRPGSGARRRGRPDRPARAPARHARLPRPPARRRARRRSSTRCGRRGRRRRICRCSRRRYRETRSVAMLVLDDEGGARHGARRRRPGASGGARRLPARGPALAPAPHRGPLSGAAAAPARAAAGLRNVRSVRRGCLPVTTAAGGAQYDVLGIGRSRRLRVDKHEALDVALGQIERQFGKGSVMKMNDRAAVSIGAVSTGSLALDLALGDRRAAARPHRRGLRPGVLRQDDARLPRDRRGAAPRRHLRLHRRRARDGPGLREADRRRHRQPPRLAARHGRAGARDRRAAHPLRARSTSSRSTRSRRSRRRRRSRARWATPTSACRRASCRRRCASSPARSTAPTRSASSRTSCARRSASCSATRRRRPGGRALKFYASVRLDIRRIETLKEGVEAIGNRIRVKVVKNKVAPPFKQAEFDIMYGTGFSWEGTVLDSGLERKVVTKSGSYFSFGDERLGQGRQNATAFLQEHPDVTQQILQGSSWSRAGAGRLGAAAAGRRRANGGIERQARRLAAEALAAAAARGVPRSAAEVRSSRRCGSGRAAASRSSSTARRGGSFPPTPSCAPGSASGARSTARRPGARARAARSEALGVGGARSPRATSRDAALSSGWRGRGRRAAARERRARDARAGRARRRRPRRARAGPSCSPAGLRRRRDPLRPRARGPRRRGRGRRSPASSPSASGARGLLENAAARAARPLGAGSRPGFDARHARGGRSDLRTRPDRATIEVQLPPDILPANCAFPKSLIRMT